MSDSKTEASEDRVGTRELQFGEVLVKQKARVTQLQHPVHGTTYLIDITDQEDPSTKDPDEGTSKGKVVSEMLEGRLGNAANYDQYSLNNGVFALITDRLDKGGRRRLYLGIEIVNPKDNVATEITSQILDISGFKQGSFYVPFSFDSILAKRYVGDEIEKAVTDSPGENLFPDAQKLLLE